MFGKNANLIRIVGYGRVILGAVAGSKLLPQLRRGGELFYPYAFLLLILFSE